MSYLTSPKNPNSPSEIEKRIDRENACFLSVCCIPLCIIGITHCLWTSCIKAPYNGLRGLKNRYVEKKKLKRVQELKREKVRNSLEITVIDHL